MVVGPQQVEQLVEAALPLVDVVGRVAGEVGQLAVGPDQHPVLVVAEVGGAHPQRTVGVVEVAQVAQLLQAGDHVVALVQRPLGEPHVEAGVEGLQLVLLLLQLQGVARLAEGHGPRLALQRDDAGVGCHDGVGEVLHVGALVAVVGHRLPERPCLDRGAEQVHLVAAVVDVELPGDLGAGRLEHARDRVADDRPPGVPQVERPGGVGGDELHVDPLAGERLGVAVGRPGRHDLRCHPTLGRGGHGDVEEAGPGDLDGLDAGVGGEPVGEQLGQRAGTGARPLRQLQRDVGGVVAVLPAARALHRHRRRDLVERDRTLGHQRRQDAGDGMGELLGGHRPSLSAPRHRHRTGFTHRRRRRYGQPAPRSRRRAARSRLRSSGDRALVSGTRCRRFESCRRRPSPAGPGSPEGGRLRGCELRIGQRPGGVQVERRSSVATMSVPPPQGALLAAARLPAAPAGRPAVAAGGRPVARHPRGGPRRSARRAQRC